MGRRLLIAAVSGIAALLMAASLAGPAAAQLPTPDNGPSSVRAQVTRVREHTDQFRRLAHAREHGYGLLRDAAGVACIDDPAGGMGVHYVSSRLVGDAEVRALRPEALVYEPTAHGHRLVALEYVVFRKAWRSAHPHGRPELFGQRFELAHADNRYGLPPFYELHLWAWKHNPSGLFDDWNPRVHCPPAA